MNVLLWLFPLRCEMPSIDVSSISRLEAGRVFWVVPRDTCCGMTIRGPRLTVQSE